MKAGDKVVIACEPRDVWTVVCVEETMVWGDPEYAVLERTLSDGLVLRKERYLSDLTLYDDGKGVK